MRRLLPCLLIVPICLIPTLDLSAHSPEGTVSVRADLRIDELRGLRVRTWFEVPDSSQVAQSGADAAVAQLGECLELALDGESLAGTWQAGDDPKHGLSNGSHRLFALEFEPAAAPADASLDVTLVVGCFPEKELAFSATARARSPWRLESETLPTKAAHHHGHPTGHETPEEVDADRTARVVFVRQST